MHDLTPEAFTDAVAQELRAWAREFPQDSESWKSGAKMRTHVLKGNAANGRSHEPHRHVLGRVMERFDYFREGQPGGNGQRVYFMERLKLDLVAVECPTNWADDCWQGRYRTTLACEVENDIQEFTMTMRGLLDARAELYCGIFMIAEEFGARLPVGQSHRKQKGVEQRVPLGTWPSPWDRSDDWRVRAGGDERLLAIFLSASEPKLLGARLYESGRAGGRDLVP